MAVSKYFMNDILNKSMVLVLNRNWQAVNVRTPQEAFCMMATNVATGLDIEGEHHPSSVASQEQLEEYAAANASSSKYVEDLELRRVDN